MSNSMMFAPSIAEISKSGPRVTRGVASASDGAPPYVARLRALADRVDSLGAVEQRDGTYRINREALRQLSADERQMVRMSTARAIAQAGGASRVVSAGLQDIFADAMQIGRALGAFQDKAEEIARLIAVVHDGARPRVAWSGLSVDLPHESARALATLLGMNAVPVIGALAPLAPTLAPVLTIILAASGLLAGWIEATLEGSGGDVRLELLFWVVPLVQDV